MRRYKCSTKTENARAYAARSYASVCDHATLKVKACEPHALPGWKSSQSFSRNEIPLAIYVLQKAFEAMLEKPKGEEITQAIEEERVVQ